MPDEKKRIALTKRFNGLKEIEKRLLQVISLIYEPTSRTTIVNVWSHIPVAEKLNTALTAAKLDPYLSSFRDLELIDGTQLTCNPLIAEIIPRQIAGTPLIKTYISAIETKLPLNRWGGVKVTFEREEQFIRMLRCQIYANDFDGFTEVLANTPSFIATEDLWGILERICHNPFDREWFLGLNVKLREILTKCLLSFSGNFLTRSSEVWELALEEVKQQPDNYYTDTLIELLPLKGKLKEAQNLHNSLPPDRQNLVMEANFYFLTRETQKAIKAYEESISFYRKETRKRKVFLAGISGIFFIMALLQDGTGNSLNRALEYLTGAESLFDDSTNKLMYHLLTKVVKMQLGDPSQREQISRNHIAACCEQISLVSIVVILCFYWLKPEESVKVLPKILVNIYGHCLGSHYLWLARSVLDLLLKLEPDHSLGKELAKLPEGLVLADIIRVKQDWEVQLEALLNFNQTDRDPKKQNELRLVWFLSSDLSVQPKEQTLGAKGWTKGKPIALKRLKESATSMPHLLPQDLRAIAHIKTQLENDYGWGSKNSYDFNNTTLLSLVGHPHVYWESSPTAPIEVVLGELELRVKKIGTDRLSIQLHPPLSKDAAIVAVKETPRRLKVIPIKDEHLRLARILGSKNKLEVPESAKEQVLGVIQNISQVLTVHSDIGGGVVAVEVPAEDRIHIHLLPSNTGLRVAVLVRPFATGGPYFAPGEGGETVIAEIDGQHLQTTRNLKAEKRRAQQTIEACPTLATVEQTDREHLLEDPETCLEFLTELQTLGDEVTIEHPEGEKFRVSRPLDFRNFHVQIGSQQDWFAIEGELRVGHDQVIDMQQLLQLLEQTNHRFIPLGEGQFLALTQEFRSRLEELRAYGERSGKKLKVHPLAAVAMEDWLEEVGSLKTNSHWENLVKRLQEIKDLKPQLPSTLQAELRDYQIEGFQWLARLAHWGVGACLADDMGLGKTLQALSLILSRAEGGPSLVIAPTSVCLNWISEAAKFAPTLNLCQLVNTDRQKLVDSLESFDLLVCSYGLLQQDEVAEMLAKVSWQTIVLDEAQSIKNFATKRSQAAMNLQGGFKLLTTGTPIENHLGELWNLFRFINPGLLGSLEKFNQRYAIPIERNNDKEARQRLKRLIQPFILRRTKNQVLQELPPRTEVLIQVELSPEEVAFYEALRRESLEQLSNSNSNEAQHMKVLAAIMKLRRACCHTSLVRPEISLTSSKLQQFGEIITEIRENHHKALVFSQFVDHLRLIEDYLKEQNISYQYLDGSTPATERQKRVKAFQAGEGDVFLISLKAGGTGLNLTAADFVIHMDPWWNPAVEDQASDRAHRIGQQRPVTIYRLVAQGTIEEKIVKLHSQKRDLADSLLEGTEMSAKVSTADLIKLIAEG